MGWTWSLDKDTTEHANALQLTNTERVVLAKFAYEEAQHGPRTYYEVCTHIEGRSMWEVDGAQREAYLSLSRMAYIVGFEPRTVRHATAVDTLSEAGRARLLAVRARHYVCCEFAIRQPCVCSESTYCPNPDHRGGCHGTHD
jgi:hypothetical protein